MTGKRPDLDVVVVGAGPAGCECARRLADASYRVLVVEEHASAGEPVHCTGVISSQAYAAFELPESAIQSELTAVELTSPGGIALRVDLNGARAYSVDRGEVDVSLASRAQAAGAEFSYETRARDLEVGRSGVTLSGVRARQPWTTRARAVVLATGAKSRLPQKAGLASAYKAIYGAQAEVRMSSPPTMRVWIGEGLVPGGFGWAVPGREGWSRVGVLTRGKPKPILLQVARRALDGATESLDEEAIRVHPIPAAPRYPTCGDRVLSVGDAAGQVKMTTGGGVYYGLLASRIAAEVLADGLSEGRLGARYLRRYESLWRRLLGPEQRAGQMLRKLASSVPDAQIDEIFRSAEARGLSRYLLDLVDFDWHARSGVGLALTMLSAVPGQGLGLRWLKRLMS